MTDCWAGLMEKVMICLSLKETEAQSQTAFPDTVRGVVVATGCNIIRRRVASIGGLVFSSPASSMEVRQNDDGAVSWNLVSYEPLDMKLSHIRKWATWFWVWGRGGTVREVRETRQQLVWHCHSGRSACFLMAAESWKIFWNNSIHCADEYTWIGMTSGRRLKLSLSAC